MSGLLWRALKPRPPQAYARLLRSCLQGIIKEMPGRVSSYSQFGEDVILERLLGEAQTGFYVDVGAYSPTVYSNTKRFYKRGWNGINIEPVPDHHRKFVRHRPRDINLNVGVAETPGTMTLYCMQPDTLTTFDESEARRYASFSGHRIRGTLEVRVLPLANILAEHLKGQTIDFLSIDVEGLERRVLLSNDWSKYRPRVVLIEAVRYFPEEQADRATNGLWEDILLERRYRYLGSTLCNSFYGDEDDHAIIQNAAHIWQGSAVAGLPAAGSATGCEGGPPVGQESGTLSALST